MPLLFLLYTFSLGAKYEFFSNLALLLSVDSIFSVIFTCLYVVELSETGLKTSSNVLKCIREEF